MKTNKHQTLLLVKHKNKAQARDLVHAFHYTPGTARSYLAHLGRQDLLQRSEGGHLLTPKGENRLQFFEVAGCGQPECPRCQEKSGYYTCQVCGARLDKAKARLKPAWDTLLFTRAPGLYCAVCQTQMFTEEQARLAGIREEDRP